MQKLNQLNLLIVDDNQLYAEQLIDLLQTHYYKSVNLGFLDAKDELIKLLRQPWDVLLMGNAYDLTLKDVKQLLKAQHADIPVIAIISDDVASYPHPLSAAEQAQTQLVKDNDRTNPLLPLFYYWGAADALPKDRLLRMAIRVCREHQHSQTCRELARLKQILNDAELRDRKSVV